MKIQHFPAQFLTLKPFPLRTMYMNSEKKGACTKDERGKFELANMRANFMHINIIRKSVLFVILVISCFGFEGWSWVLIASVPDLCILLTFTTFTLRKLS